MKQIFWLLAITFLVGGVSMAQNAPRRDGKKFDPKERVERMTERMAKEYSLNDTQKQQLLEANTALFKDMGNMPKFRRPNMRFERRNNRCCCCCCCNKAKMHKRAHRKPLTEAERTERKAKMEKFRKDMKAAHDTYNAQLQKIMTQDQYAAYSAKKQKGFRK
jgi:hypothetical protein